MKKATSKITVNINRAVWNAFNEFVHPDFGLRRDTCLNNWIAGSLSGKGERKNSEEWLEIIRGFRKSTAKNLRSVAIALDAEVADKLQKYCDEHLVHRDMLVERLLWTMLVGFAGSKHIQYAVQDRKVVYCGALEHLVTIINEGPNYDLASESMFAVDFGMNLTPIDGPYEIGHWMADLYFTEDELADYHKGLLPIEKLRPHGIAYWLFVRAMWLRLKVDGCDYHDPDRLVTHLLNGIADTVPAEHIKILSGNLDRNKDAGASSDVILSTAYLVLSDLTGLRDLFLEDRFGL